MSAKAAAAYRDSATTRRFDWKDLRRTADQFVPVVGASNSLVVPNLKDTPDAYMLLQRIQSTHMGQPSPLRLTVPDHVVQVTAGTLFWAALRLYTDSRTSASHPVDAPELQYEVSHIARGAAGSSPSIRTSSPHMSR